MCTRREWGNPRFRVRSAGKTNLSSMKLHESQTLEPFGSPRLAVVMQCRSAVSAVPTTVSGYHPFAFPPQALDYGLKVILTIRSSESCSRRKSSSAG